MRSAGEACGRGEWSEAAVSRCPWGPHSRGRGQPLGGGARSVVAVALAGLVHEGPGELLGAAGRALPGPVLPLQRLLAQAVPLRQLLGPLQPLRLPRLVQRRRLHRQRPAVVRHGPLRPRLRPVPAETAGSAGQRCPRGGQSSPTPAPAACGGEGCSSKAGSATPEKIQTPPGTPLCPSPLSLVCLHPTVTPLEPWLVSGSF